MVSDCTGRAQLGLAVPDLPRDTSAIYHIGKAQLGLEVPDLPKDACIGRAQLGFAVPDLPGSVSEANDDAKAACRDGAAQH